MLSLSLCRPGVYEELSYGGLSARLTFGLVHPKIRQWVASQPHEQLLQLAVRADVGASIRAA